MSDTYQWRQVLGAALLWFVGGALVGILVALISGEHGSIIFAMLGVAIGLCGGVSNTALLFSSHFRHLPTLRKHIILWLATMVAFLVLGAVLAWPPRDLLVLSLYVALPTLLASIGINHVLARNSRVGRNN